MNLMIPKKLIIIFNDNELNNVLTEYFDYLKSKSLSENTIKNYFRDLIDYFNYLNQNNLSAFKSIKPEHIRKMLSFLIDRGFSKLSISRKISAIKSYLTFLEKFNYSSDNFSELITIPKKTRSLPKVMTEKEINQLIKHVEINTKKNYLSLRKYRNGFLTVGKKIGRTITLILWSLFKKYIHILI